MNFKILTVGTRGDIQPFVALAKGLIEHGHMVTICTGVNFKAFVEEHGISFLPVRVDYQELTQSERGKQMLGSNPFQVMRNMKDIIFPMMEQMLQYLWDASRDADVLIYHPKAFGGYDIAEKLKIQSFIAHPVPIIAPTSLITNPALPIDLPFGWMKTASFYMNRLFMMSFFKLINKWREETLGLHSNRSIFTNDLKLRGKPIPVLYGCSSSIVPFDPKWNKKVSMNGFWFLESDASAWEPSQELLEFLNKGSAPIVISFSSMPLKNPNVVYEMLAAALKKTKQRGILITGWSGMRENSLQTDDLFTIESIPHSWLFPQTKGIIHHGGAGTTAAVLKAGKPMIICPFSGDQPFWGRRMHEIGVATKPLKEKDMSMEAFCDRILELVSNNLFSENAAKLSRKIEQENGITDTVKFIEDILSE